jgi:hypothetical protein
MKVTTADNKTMSQAKFTSDGGVEFFGVKSLLTLTPGNAFHAVGGNQSYRYEGEVSTFTAGNVFNVNEGNISGAVSGTIDTTVGVDSVELINRDKTLNIGGGFKVIATGGSPAAAIPTNTAVELHAVNGAFTINVGDPMAGSVPTALPGFNVFVYNGMITLGSNPLKPAGQCAISLNTTLPNSIGLGCTPPGAWSAGAPSNPPTDFAMLFTKWSTLMTTLIGLLDTHTHSTAWGPSGPAMAPAPGGFNTAITGQLLTVKSLRVLMGA